MKYFKVASIFILLTFLIIGCIGSKKAGGPGDFAFVRLCSEGGNHIRMYNSKDASHFNIYRKMPTDSTFQFVTKAKSSPEEVSPLVVNWTDKNYCSEQARYKVKAVKNGEEFFVLESVTMVPDGEDWKRIE